MIPSPWLEYRNFKGICNTTDPSRIPSGRRGTYLQVAENVDIDDEMMIHRRQGFTLLKEGDTHSLWSNGNICLYCQDEYLYRLYEDGLTEILLGGVSSERMNYVEAGGVIYFSNKTIVGMIEKGKPYPFPNPNQNFKARMVGGHLIEFYNSRLYVAQNDRIFFSDAAYPTRMDIRKNFIQLEGWIKMLKSVRGGLYVGAGNNVYFLAGDDPLQPGFVFNKVSESRVIEGSAIKAEVGEAMVVLWASDDGIFMGTQEGVAREITGGMYSVANAEKGAAIYRDDLFGQYLFVYELIEDRGGGEIKLRLPSMRLELWTQ